MIKSCRTRDASRLLVVMMFDRRALLYDIRNGAYVEGHKMPDEAEHSRHLTIDIGEEGNIDRVDRMMNLYMSKAADLLLPYSKVEIHGGDYAPMWNDLPVEPEMYFIRLALPATVSHTTVTFLENAIHEWVVARVLGEWLSITSPEAAAAWMAKAESLEGDIKSAKLRTGSVLRRPTCPI